MSENEASLSEELMRPIREAKVRCSAQEAARRLGILQKPDVEHYNGTIEPIDYMREIMSHEEFRGFLRGNVIKYVSRFHRKGGVEDLRKARVYQDWLIEHERDAPTD